MSEEDEEAEYRAMEEAHYNQLLAQDIAADEEACYKRDMEASYNEQFREDEMSTLDPKQREEALRELNSKNNVLVNQEYDELIAKFESEGVGDARISKWGSRETQNLRFEQLVNLMIEQDPSFSTVLDVGCGNGGLLAFLHQDMNFLSGPENRYLGLDINPAMINLCAARFGKLSETFSNFNFYTDDILFSKFNHMPFEFVVSSGIFGSFKVNAEQLMKILLDKMWEMCTQGMIYNCISTFADEGRINDFATNPGLMLDYCMKRFGRKVVLKHNYLPHDYTLAIYK